MNSILIGHRGASIQSLEQKYKDKVTFTYFMNGMDLVVIEKGLDETVSEILKEFTLVATYALSKEIKREEQKLNSVVVELIVEKKALGFLIGRKGDKIKKLVADYEVEIKMPRKFEQSEKVRISGMKENVAKVEKIRWRRQIYE